LEPSALAHLSKPPRLSSVRRLAAGSLSQVFQQMPASGDLVGIGVDAGQGAQHGLPDVAALLVETRIVRAGFRSVSVGNAANRGGHR
jgi:hypothetical protein